MGATGGKVPGMSNNKGSVQEAKSIAMNNN